MYNTEQEVVEAAKQAYQDLDAAVTAGDNEAAQEALRRTQELQGEYTRFKADNTPSDRHTDLPAGDSVTWSGAEGATRTYGSGVSRFTDKVTKAFEDAAPVVGGPAVKRALTTSGNLVADFDGRIIEETREPHRLLSVINVEQTDAATGQYLRQTARDNEATTVKSGDLKPMSNFDLSPAQWRLSTVAHLSNPIQRQWLADYAGLEQFITAELAYGVNEALETFVLSGGIDEDGENVSGVLDTSGVRQTEHTGSAISTILQSLTNAAEEGTTSTGIVLRPSDWGAIEQQQLDDGSYLFGGSPSDAASLRLRGVPVVLSTAVEPGTALVGDLKTVTLRYRNSLELAWSESSINTGTVDTPAMRDLFRRNQLVFRAETRVALELTQPHRLHVAELAQV